MIPDCGISVEVAFGLFWQVTVVAIVVGVITRLFCRKRPHLAYALWVLVIIKFLTPPVWSSPVGVFSWVETYRSSASTNPAATSRPPATRSVLGEQLHESRPQSSPTHADPPEHRWRAPTLLGGLWVGGAMVCVAIIVAKWVACHLLLRRSQRPVATGLAESLGELSERLGVRRKVRVLVTSKPLGPAVWGLYRPTLLLPEALISERSLKHIELLLAHELMHVRRGDVWVAMLQLAAQVVWWFHPVVWWVGRQIGRERERCCDEEVVARLGCEPGWYAQSLLDVVAFRKRLRPVFGRLGVRSSGVTSTRLESIMNRDAVFHHRMPRTCWVVLILGMVLLVPGAALTLEPAEGKSGASAQKTQGTDASSDALEGSGAGAPDTIGKVVAFDDFPGKFMLNWNIFRHDPTHYSLSKNPGSLTITTQCGAIHRTSKGAKNIFLIDNPLPEDGDFVVTACITSFHPTTRYQQAGLICYNDDDNYLKWDYEYSWRSGIGRSFILVRETDGKVEHDLIESRDDLEHFWLRLTKRGDRYECASSTDGKTFRIHGEMPWPDRVPKQIGIIAKNGGNKLADEIDVSFDSFELRALPEVSPGESAQED